MRFTRCTMPPVRLKKTLYANKALENLLYSHKAFLAWGDAGKMGNP